MATRIRGVVVRTTNGTPAQGVTVYARATDGSTDEANWKAATDLNGFFNITGLPDKTWVAYAKSSSYRVLILPDTESPEVIKKGASDYHPEVHGQSAHSGLMGEAPLVIRLPLAKPLVANGSVASLEDYEHKAVWTNAGFRINRMWVKFQGNVLQDTTLKLQRNGVDVAGASVTVTGGTAESSVVSFGEVALADGDSLTIVKTAGGTDDIAGSVYVLGERDVVGVVTY